MTLRLPVLMMILLILVACSPQAEPIATQSTPVISDNASTDDNTNTGESDNTSAGESDIIIMPEDDASPYNAPEWTTIPLVNVRTGETFTLADLEGKVVMVHAMATWCSNCRQQQGNLRSALPELNEDEVVFISMSVENNLEAQRLAEYANNNDFDWTFFVAPRELMVALTDEFGRTITNPPATPRFLISPAGAVSSLRTGFHTTQDIIAEVEALLQG